MNESLCHHDLHLPIPAHVLMGVHVSFVVPLTAVTIHVSIVRERCLDITMAENLKLKLSHLQKNVNNASVYELKLRICNIRHCCDRRDTTEYFWTKRDIRVLTSGVSKYGTTEGFQEGETTGYTGYCC